MRTDISIYGVRIVMHFLFQEFFKDAINKMAERSLRCVAVAYKTCEADTVPTDEEQLAQWTLPEDDLVLLSIVGIKVVNSVSYYLDSHFLFLLNT